MRRLVILVSAIVLLDTAFYSAVAPLLPHYVDELDLSKSAAGILTGSFACAMAFHNAAMRYYYAMGREGILPKALGRTHPTHKSPHVASVFRQARLVHIVFSRWAQIASPSRPMMSPMMMFMAVLHPPRMPFGRSRSLPSASTASSASCRSPAPSTSSPSPLRWAAWLPLVRRNHWAL